MSYGPTCHLILDFPEVLCPTVSVLYVPLLNRVTTSLQLFLRESSNIQITDYPTKPPTEEIYVNRKLNSKVFWVVILCSLGRAQCFGRTYLLLLQDQRIRKQETSRIQLTFRPRICRRYIFSETLEYLPDYMAFQQRRPQCS
jgi:hypothetical protein